MPLEVVRNDITKMMVDAIVNTACRRPTFGPGTDETVYRAAGMAQMLAARLAVGTIPYGSAAVTDAFRLEENGVRYIIHAVYSDYYNKDETELETLRSAYRKSLALAVEHGCKSVAIPLLGAGNRGYPIDLAIDVALAELYSFLHTHDMMIYLVLFSPLAWEQAQRLFPQMTDYFHSKKETEDHPEESKLKDKLLIEMFDRVMDEKNMKPGDIYNVTSVTRQMLSKVRNNSEYHLGKSKVLELAIALKLSLPETDYFLSLSDYAFHPGRRRDQIIQKCIQEGIDSIFAMDEILYREGEETLFSEK